MLVCISWNVRNILVTRLFWFAETLFVFVCSVLHMLNTERRRYDVHVLFSYGVRSAHWRVNSKIKRKFTLYISEYHIFFISYNANIPIFKNTDENTRWKYQWCSQQNSNYTLYSRTSMARTPMARLPWLIRTRFWVPTKEKYLRKFSYFIVKFYVVCTH